MKSKIQQLFKIASSTNGIKITDIKKAAKSNIAKHKYWYYRTSLLHLSTLFLYLFLLLPALMTNQVSNKSQIIVVGSSILYLIINLSIKITVINKLLGHTLSDIHNGRQILDTGIVYTLYMLGALLCGLLIISFGYVLWSNTILSNLVVGMGLIVLIGLPLLINFRYSIALIIAIDNPNLAMPLKVVKQNLKTSKDTMKNNYKTLFKLRLSFLLWDIIMFAVSMGLLNIYLYQYKLAALVEFERRVNNENI